MQIVIDIPDTEYDVLNQIGENTIPLGILLNLRDYIRFGTPLPKGHGDLIDKDRLLDELEKTVKSVDDTNRHLLFWDRAVAHVHLSEPIIEADKADKEVQKQIKQIGYKGCRNCKHQISPLRMCKWAEQGGDGRIHFICPMWDKTESEDKECR